MAGTKCPGACRPKRRIVNLSLARLVVLRETHLVRDCSSGILGTELSHQTPGIPSLCVFVKLLLNVFAHLFDLL
jgi:hypothetical protein